MSNKETEKAEEKREPVEKEESITPEVLEKLPPRVKKGVEMFLSMQRFIGPVFPPFLDKINAEHITKVLEISEKEDERSFEDAKAERKYGLIRLCIFCLVLLFLFVFTTVYLVDRDKELYGEIIKNVLLFLSGLAAGFGIKTYLVRKGE